MAAAERRLRQQRGVLSATRNYIAVLTTVNCSATVAKLVVRRTEDEIAALHPDGVDGVVALTHGSGCGMADSGPGWDVLRRTLTGYARHPNIGGIVVVGLGCEVNDLSSLVAESLRLAPELHLVRTSWTPDNDEMSLEALRDMIEGFGHDTSLALGGHTSVLSCRRPAR